MRVTSAGANKLLRQLNEEYAFLSRQDALQRVYPEIQGIGPIIPDYDVNARTEQMDATAEKICRLKHAVNLFNISTTLPGHNFTIDEALVRMAFLSQQKDRLNAMRGTPVKRLITGMNSRNNQVEYEIANFDPKEAEKLYNKVSEELSALQLALDAVNSTEEFDADI